MIAALPALVTTVGLACDIIGALLIANEVVRVFNGPATIDVGDTGTFNGGSDLVPNPAFEAHERKKRNLMKWGLGLLLVGFLLQGLGTWLPYVLPQPSASGTRTTTEPESGDGRAQPSER